MNKNIELKIIVLYVLSFVLILFLIQHFFFPEILNEKNFLNWDAEHYYWIKNYGYKDFRVAFFPLFPAIWKITFLPIYGIVVLNTFIFLSSFYLLTKIIKTTPLETLIYISIPSFCFFLLPYTESVFFASSTILLIGLKRKKNNFVIVGLLLSTLARPAFTIFIPALVIAELLCEQLNKKTILRIILYVVTTLIGILLVAIIQHHYTGVWFEFFSVQQGWGNKLQVPHFPLTSWAGGLIIRLDGAAMLLGTIAGIILLLYIFKSKIVKHITIPKEVIFSIAYLAGITLSVFLFRGGLLFSLNRFVFATPFIIIAANFYLNQSIIFSRKQMLVGFLLIFAFWLCFASYVHIQTLLKYLLLSIYLFLMMMIKTGNKTLSKLSFVLFISINIVFQFLFFIRFLSGNWVG